MGIDEAFIDVSETVSNYSDAKVLAQKIKDEIFMKIHLTCSVGIGPNKQIAKIASDYQKPNGITYVRVKEVQSFLDPLSVDKIIGVGPKTKKILNEELKIKTIGELANLPIALLKKRFKKMGIYLHEVARGIDNSPVQQFYQRKSLGSEITFDKDVKDFTKIYQALELIIDKLHDSLIRRKYLFQTVVIKIRFSNFSTYTRQHHLKTPTNDKRVAIKFGKQLLKEFQSDPRKVRLLGFRFTELSKVNYVQRTLLDYFRSQ